MDIFFFENGERRNYYFFFDLSTEKSALHSFVWNNSLNVEETDTRLPYWQACPSCEGSFGSSQVQPGFDWKSFNVGGGVPYTDSPHPDIKTYPTSELNCYFGSFTYAFSLSFSRRIFFICISFVLSQWLYICFSSPGRSRPLSFARFCFFIFLQVPTINCVKLLHRQIIARVKSVNLCGNILSCGLSLTTKWCCEFENFHL